ncbi:MAG: hypothetical protein L0Y45_04040 [Woeseiaceae bacterium]|nr:hypothetical protein [Woeseiaceae bacterium]
MRRLLLIPVLMSIAAAACGGEIYLRDGVTDGDTFYLSDIALRDDDPVLQSWVSYSLTRSACQLQIGGDNPARATSFDCELTARQHLLETWQEQRGESPVDVDPYLDDLLFVQQAGFLDEYVAHYFRRKSWQLPADMQSEAFHDWRREFLRGHKPQTRLTGSWNYAEKVRQAQ